MSERENKMTPLVEIIQNSKRKNIAIYGGTKKQYEILRRKLFFAKVYYMDFEQISNRLDCLSSVAALETCEIDAFILLRQLIAKQDVFSLLMSYCKNKGAVIFDEKGNNISEICNEALGVETCNKDSLEKEIKDHECISFDIFDTLLTRNVLFPSDIFELVSLRLKKKGICIKRFAEKRNKAQEELGLTNPNIYEIYARFCKNNKISEDVAKECIQTELGIEKELLIAREDMLTIYRKCVEAGKKVYLVSDMYIPEELLTTILHANGITGYKRMYVSCDRKQLKLQGLLSTWKQEVKGKSYLHIGDHLIHDGICAGIAGVDYCLIANGYKLAQKTLFLDCMKKASNLEERIMLGMAIARVMNSPFVEVKGDGVFSVNEDFDFGYGFCAAIVSQFAIWLYDQVKKLEVDEVLFAARDGYLMQKMYEMLCKIRKEDNVPKGKYFYTSRKASVMTGINNEAFINMIIDISVGMPPEKMMRERFGLTAKEIKVYDVEKYGDSVHAYVWDHAQAIFKRADEAKINYFRYMGKIGLDIGKKYALMDFVSSGTSQKALARMAPFEIKGLYAGWNGLERKEEVGVDAMFEDKNSFFLRRFKIMETFMSSKEPSLNYFNKDGEPVFARQDRNQKEMHYVSVMHRACLEFFEEFLAIVQTDSIEIHNIFTDSVFAVSEKVECQSDKCLWNHLTLMDDWRRKKDKIERIIQ